MKAKAVYSQVPLAPEQRDIRILVLARGDQDDQLRGHLFVESLDYEDVHYTALSYTWAGPVIDNGISIDGSVFDITENLWLALRQFRHLTRAIHLWIDAICINQGDDSEKGEQVALMGDIYSNATRTWIWLGAAANNSDQALEFVRSLRYCSGEQVRAIEPDSIPCESNSFHTTVDAVLAFGRTLDPES